MLNYHIDMVRILSTVIIITSYYNNIALSQYTSGDYQSALQTISTISYHHNLAPIIHLLLGACHAKQVYTLC